MGEGCIRQFPLARLILAACCGFPNAVYVVFFPPIVLLLWALCCFLVSLNIHVCVNYANLPNFLATESAGGNLGHKVSQLCVTADC